MTRNSFQKGYIFPRVTARGKVHVVRYRIRTASGEWRHRAETVNSPRRKDAERVLAERLREVNRGLRLAPEVTFEDFSTDQWKTYVESNLKPSTQASHESGLKKHLIPAFGGFKLDEINALLIMEFLKRKSAEGLKPKTILNLFVLLQKMLNLAVDIELIQSNPIRRVPKPKVQRTEKPALTPVQVKAVVDHMPESLRALIVVLYLTGLRIGEALALKWSDVDFLNEKIYVRRSVWHGKEQSPKSRRSVRAKHLLPRLAEELKRHKHLSHHKGPENYVFSNGKGGSVNPNDLRKRVLYPAMDTAGIKRETERAFGFHLFRHSAGSSMQQATGDLKQTQSFLGHSGIAITGDTYIHLQPDAEIEAMEKLENTLYGDLCSIVLKQDAVVGQSLPN